LDAPRHRPPDAVDRGPPAASPGESGAGPASDELDESAIEAIVDNEPSKAIEALTQIRIGREGEIPSAQGLDTGARGALLDRGQYWVMVLKAKDCLATFAAALRAHGCVVGEWRIGIDDSTIPDERLQVFLSRARAFRCKIRVGTENRGSGVLVGPSSVLTAWHVIAAASPRDVRPPLQDLNIQLADGRTIDVSRVVAASPCGDREWEGHAPKSDDEVEGKHDVALLRLKQPAGIHLSFAPLATPAYPYRGPLLVILISYPEGEWHGLAYANLKRLRNISARWGYDVKGARGGSSGGGCFDTNLCLAGIHQGRANDVRRLVPLIRFDEFVRQAIVDDETPQKLWSLDGTPDSTLVVARDGFFTGYQAAMRGPARARGLWIRRVNLKDDVSGLPFSYDLLDKLVARSPSTRLVRVSFDALIEDLPAEVARRATEAGIAVDAPAARNGVDADQTEPEAVVADRSRLLARALDARAREMNVLLWVFFDHPSIVFGDAPRWALTAFVDQVLRLERLRICLAGYEPVQMPGAQFDSPEDAVNAGEPGLMVEYLGHVMRQDIGNLIETAARDMGRSVSRERVEEWTDEALDGFQQVNHRYDSALRSAMASRLQPHLKWLRDKGAPA